MVRIGHGRTTFRDLTAAGGLDRRELMAGLGLPLSARCVPALAAAEARPSLALQAKADAPRAAPGQPDTPIWSLGAAERARSVSSAAMTLEVSSPTTRRRRSRSELAWARRRPRSRAAAGRDRRSPPRPSKASRFPCVTPGPSCATSGCWATAGAAVARRGRWSSAKASRSPSTATRCCCSRTGGCGRTEPRSRPGTDPKDTVAVYTVNGRRIARHSSPRQ